MMTMHRYELNYIIKPVSYRQYIFISFILDFTDGLIVLLTAVDYETRSFYSMTVRACDVTNTSCTEVDVINLVVVNANELPYFSPNTTQMSIPEELVSYVASEWNSKCGNLFRDVYMQQVTMVFMGIHG